jgi:xanthine dehydrogenase accessory factor
MWGMHRVARLGVRLDTSLESLLERAPQDLSARVLATVVATAGSTYRKPGARMLIMADGSYLGLLSGGCLEADLNIHARGVLESGIPRAVEYDMRGPDDILFGIGAGCEGAMRVLLEPAGPGSVAAVAMANAGRAVGLGRATSLVAVHESPDLVLGTYDATAPLPPELVAASKRALEDTVSREIAFETGGGRTRALIQFLGPPPHLLICGAGPDAQPVVSAALALGWRVSVVDHRPAYAVAERFPGANVRHADARDLRTAVAVGQCHAAVVMSHHLASGSESQKSWASPPRDCDPAYGDRWASISARSRRKGSRSRSSARFMPGSRNATKNPMALAIGLDIVMRTVRIIIDFRL